MLFNSYIFILFFLPVCFSGYFLLNKFKLYNLGQLFLLGMSLWFYGFFNTEYVLIILSSVVFNYLVYRFLDRAEKTLYRKLALITGLVFNIGILGYFKYTDFFIENVNAIFKTDFTLLGILLPLGISFFTFQQISFVVDAYKRDVPKYNFLYYASFVTFYPQLIAGPIVTHDELVPQFLDRSKKQINWDNLSQGIFLFVLGMAKKMLIADVFGNAVNWGFGNIPELNSTNAVLVMLAYTFQIYFDFSGYCDMAIGIGKMFNIDLPLNFNSPYKSLTITEFWKRWHMTLTRFFTKYVYIPLGGNRKGEARTYLNTMIVFLISGFWHGANWTFVLWGALHGIFLVIARRFKGFFERLHPALNWIVTFAFVNLTWVLFRADSISDAFSFYKKIGQFNFGPIDRNISDCFRLDEVLWILDRTPVESAMPYFMLMIFFVGTLIIVLGAKNAFEKMNRFRPTVINLAATVVLLVWCIFSMSGVSTFLYFNF